MQRTRTVLATLLCALSAAPAAAQTPTADSAAARAQAIADSAAARAVRMQQEVQQQAMAQRDSAAAEAQAQQAAPEQMPLDPPRPMPQGPPISADEVKLVFDREVYRYESGGRRDPFRPLTDGEHGPRFEDLVLRMILHSNVPGQSIVVLADGSRKTWRLRQGESVGNITVVAIAADRVTFAVTDFGISRREVLSIKPDNETEGA